jgi:hypothetical protein
LSKEKISVIARFMYTNLYLLETDFAYAVETHKYLRTWKHPDFYVKHIAKTQRIWTLLHGFTIELAYLVILSSLEFTIN